MTDRRLFLAAGVAAVGTTLMGCDTLAGLGMGDGWVTLIDGPKLTTLDGWTQVGEGNWSIVDGAVQGTNGKTGFLVSRQAYTDFEMRVEFWADADANSGVFLRCQDRTKIGSDNSYEVNIFDKRPDPSYGTGAIVDVAKAPLPYPKAANRWNLYEISAKGDRLVVLLNGQLMADVRNGKHRSGPFALQSYAGVIRFRKVQIRPISA